MFLKIFISAFLLSAQASNPSSTALPSAKFIDPEDYAIKRFGEVVSTEIASEPKSPQEELIALRAKLAMAERDFEQIRSRPVDESTHEKTKLSRKELLKAAEALTNDYQKQIDQLESKILLQAKKEEKKREKSSKHR